MRSLLSFVLMGILGVLLDGAVPQRCSAELLVAGFSPARHDRFENDPGFVGAGLDWSGVGRSLTGSWGTLVSPSYVLSATHAPSSDTLRFYQSNDPAGPYLERSVTAGTQIAGSDLYLARLNAPIDTSVIAAYAIGTFEGAKMLDQQIFTFGLSNGKFGQEANQRLGRNTIDQVLPDFSHPVLGASAGDVITYDYDTVNGFVPDESFLQSGDSGGPSFAIASGQPAIVGFHWFIYDPREFGPNAGSGDTFASSYVDELNLAMSQLTPLGMPVETLQTVDIAAVPEPGSLTLGLVALGGAITARAYRRRSANAVP
ncbi:MAG: PEP-CTERM sorting domain-containing protein [Aureliella sp.]